MVPSDPPQTLLARRYRIRSVLGEGGVGVAYLVDDEARGGQVALKTLRVKGAEGHRALWTELRLLRGLVHPNLAQVRDIGRLRDGRVYYTSDVLPGPDLGELARRGDWPAVRRALVGAAEGLRFLHAAQIRHGDVTPSNVLVDGAGQGVLIDLSCASRFGRVAVVAGTPGFVAPELMATGRGDGGADLFTLGVTLARVGEALAVAGAELPEPVVCFARACQREEAASRPALGELLEALGHPPSPIHAPSVEPPELLGREILLGEFDALLAAVGAKEVAPRAWVLEGPAGVGRTRLLGELAWRAQIWADRVVTGFADADRGVSAMLERAVGEALPPGPGAAVEAVDRLSDPDAGTTLLVMDDLERLSGEQARTWRALLRAVGEHGPVLVLGAEREGERAPPSSVRSGARRVSLPPLGIAELERWIAGRLPVERSSEVLRLTDGYPGDVARLMGALARGGWAVEDLVEAAEASAADEEPARLSPAAKETLAHFAATRLPLDPRDREALDLDRTAVAELVQAGLLAPEEGGFRLRRRRVGGRPHRPDILRKLADLLSVHHGVDRLAVGRRERGSVRRAAEAARLWVLAGEHDRATAALARSEEPDAWVNAARAVVALPRPPAPLAVEAARVLERAGRSDEALSAVARGLLARPAQPAALWRAAAAACLRGARYERALRYAERALRHTDEDDDSRARAYDLVSRIQLRRAAFPEAVAAAEAGLALATSEDLRADLHDDLGVAASYLGESAKAREHLAAAAELHEAGGRPRAQARSASYRALVDFRAGDADAAARGYREALELAEAAGAADLVVYAAQNLGVALHQQGDFGAAVESYERGLRLAAALADAATEATLRCNLANLYGDLGLFDRADDMATRAEALALEAGLPLIAATAASVMGEGAVWRGDVEGALAAFERALGQLGEGAARERAETLMHVAEAELARDDLAAAERALASARALVVELGADDLRARAALLEARLALARDDRPLALVELERARERAEAAGQRELLADVHRWSSQACRAQGARLLADEHAQAARRLWERTALSLPRELGAAFWRHPKRALAEVQGPEVTPGRGSLRQAQLSRLLDINKKLNSSLETAQILAWTIDSALELTGAERGYVLLAGQEGLTVAVARNIDSAAESEEARFSQNIARQVVASAEPVITVDAERDERFEAHHSVHAMRLKSVLTVPIIAPSGILGALYLDHRYRRGIFGADQIEILQAFADQVAIALENARLHQELQQKTAALAALTEGQAETIEDLSGRVRAQQEILEHRYDYANIVGQSPAMAQVFAVLDRVIDSDVAVLIQGESGTGKELIAKAIHFNGPRKDGPLVTLNCGALPDNLLESELFGYRKGAFTGAQADRDGLFVAARGGTLFLDELGEMPPAMQVKLLRVLQEREVVPLGGSEAIAVDVRVVSATNRSLRDEVAKKRFREDLFYRIGVVEVLVPPLRDRTEDIPDIARRLLAGAAEKAGKPAPDLTAAALRMLLRHPWPGNVRELENVLTKAVLLSERDTLDASDLGLAPPPNDKPRTRGAHQQAESERLLATLRATQWNVSETARRLGVSRPTVYRWMRRDGLDEP
ncbi:MAG: sigma 54-interacting transcriptional regulator [Polyangiaceae bacterium]